MYMIDPVNSTGRTNDITPVDMELTSFCFLSFLPNIERKPRFAFFSPTDGCCPTSVFLFVCARALDVA